MKLIFDISALQNPDYRDRGIGRQVAEMMRALARRGDIEIIAMMDPDLVPPLMDDDLRMRLRVINATRPAMMAARPDWLIVGAPFQEFENKARALASHVPGCRVATIFYDLIPLVFQGQYLRTARERSYYFQSLGETLRSDYILAISQSARSDLFRFAKVPAELPWTIIGAGVPDAFYEAVPTTTKLPDLGAWNDNLSNGDFVLAVTGGHFSKNTDGLLRAYEEMSDEMKGAYPLFIVGSFDSDGQRAALANLRRSVGADAGRSVEFLSGLSDEQMALLYRSCRVLIHPSRYEGFGLPPAEALVCGAVVICSNSASLPEVITDPQFRFEADNTHEMSLKLAMALTDEAFRSAFRAWAAPQAKRFRWSDVADRIVEGLSGKESRSAPAIICHRGSGDRIAVVAPFLPIPSGVAAYNNAILPRLGQYVKLDVFQYDGSLAPHLVEREAFHVNAYPLAALRHRAYKYDKIVYTLGNSFQHLPALQALELYPGTAWLHDVRLSGLFWDFAVEASPSDPWTFLEKHLAASYPEAVWRPAIIGKSLAEFASSPMICARPLLKAATDFLVHSTNASDLLSADLGRTRENRSISIVPFGLAPSMSAYRRTRSLNDVFTVGLLGFMHRIKGPESTIRAAGQVARSTERRVAVKIIGSCGVEYFSELEELAAVNGVSLETTGFAEGDFYYKSIADIDCAVQLRRSSNGESSMTVADCISLGVPVITNIPSSHEFWSDGIVPVDGMPSVGELAASLLSVMQADRSEAARRRQLAIEAGSYDVVAKRLAALFTSDSSALRDS